MYGTEMMSEAWRYYVEAWKRFGDVSGRTSVAGFWLATGVHLAIVLPLIALGAASAVFVVVGLLVSFVWIVPGLAVAIRRMHDTDRAGAWLLVALIPVAGYAWAIVLLVYSGDRMHNRFGSPPSAHARGR